MTFQSSDNVSDTFPKARQYQLLKNKTLPSPLRPPERRSRAGARTGLLCRDKKTEPVLEKINEKFVHYLWLEQPLKNINYRTADNKGIKIISAGLWNSNPGPDFTNASIHINNQSYSGDVEIHLYSSDWYRHQHHLDKNYNNLILHIAIWNDDKRQIKLENDKEIPQLILIPFLRKRLKDIDKLLELEMPLKSGYSFISTGRCYSYIKKSSPQKTLYFLESAGESRLLRKIDNFNKRLLRFNNDYEEVLYQGIMSALGYKNNQLTFLQLAETVPYQKISKIIRQYPKEKHPLIIQSILLNTAGLLPQTNSTNPDGFSEREPGTGNLSMETEYYLKSLNEFTDLSKELPETKLHWQIPGGRPANSPYRRIAGISYLLTKTPSLFDEIIKIISNSPLIPKIRQELIELLTIPATGFWSIRSSFDTKPSTKEPARLITRSGGYALIGKERVNEIVLNVIIPISFLYSRSAKGGSASGTGKQEKDCIRLNKNTKLQETVLNLYHSYSKLMDNYYTRFMKQRLFESDKKIVSSIIKTASVQQGLIEIFLDFCKKGYEGCENCGLLKFLKQY